MQALSYALFHFLFLPKDECTEGEFHFLSFFVQVLQFSNPFLIYIFFVLYASALIMSLFAISAFFDSRKEDDKEISITIYRFDLIFFIFQRISPWPWASSYTSSPTWPPPSTSTTRSTRR